MNIVPEGLNPKFLFLEIWQHLQFQQVFSAEVYFGLHLLL